uniref:Cas1_AcylT domain-containing protein n=1 Tax=Macrostomum lignano TaxID=282301 RepID=A0A1I8H3N3_9PLAT
LRIFYQRLWDLAFGQPDPEHHEVILLVSLLYYSCAMLLGRGLRHCVCACSLENGVIRKHYGMPAYLCTLLLLGVWHSGTLGDACGNPCGSWRQFVLGQARLSGTLIRMSLQMLAGAMAYRYARCCWWRLGLSSEHEMRYRITGCSSDLAVPVGAGFSIEAFATGLDLLVGLCVFSSGLRWERFQPLIKVLISTVLTYC